MLGQRQRYQANVELVAMDSQASIVTQTHYCKLG